MEEENIDIIWERVSDAFDEGKYEESIELAKEAIDSSMNIVEAYDKHDLKSTTPPSLFNEKEDSGNIQVELKILGQD